MKSMNGREYFTKQYGNRKLSEENILFSASHEERKCLINHTSLDYVGA